MGRGGSGRRRGARRGQGRDRGHGVRGEGLSGSVAPAGVGELLVPVGRPGAAPPPRLPPPRLSPPPLSSPRPPLSSFPARPAPPCPPAFLPGTSPCPSAPKRPPLARPDGRVGPGADAKLYGARGHPRLPPQSGAARGGAFFPSPTLLPPGGDGRDFRLSVAVGP